MDMNRRELNKINSRKRILKASRKLFSQKGYEETMMEDIANKAEVSKATIYNYFSNKESLLIGTANEVLDRVEAMVKSDNTDCKNSEQKLKIALEELVSASVEYLGLSRRITYLSSCEDSALYATSKKMVNIIKELVIDAQNEGLFLSGANADDIVDVIMGIYLITQFEWSHIDEYSPEFLKEKLDRFFTAMLSEYRSKSE
ncbi:TetR/AcrR family transcriptional regulator [Paratissierella segnis]|jgi:AcrR family transcriptional regulator|uniref:TetR/AcrR family transcriptional regulator n=1 Tax=Paratissierella segnis TaxID=2763679 RepID=A0A926ES90_9FIRM|nr:TetR/AcrR family transcriptional regulator [Paratissierella segnis]MBC8587585.1 TetR/AcrR family transcriptional regulator [Paratissierella segnis]